ncbi:MAG: pro-sigmaK processing inhibitor BofA family protein [Oscillospiraceae bacterium]|nr:pro-sigmaK processing inhibitor BofA family protein [Oscillospiraceae bacterium]
MDIGLTLLIALSAVFLLFLTAKVLSAPLRIAFRAALNTLLGLLALLLVEATGGITGLSLGVNLVNAAVVGLLGVPGLGLLFLAQWVL